MIAKPLGLLVTDGPPAFKPDTQGRVFMTFWCLYSSCHGERNCRGLQRFCRWPRTGLLTVAWAWFGAVVLGSTILGPANLSGATFANLPEGTTAGLRSATNESDLDGANGDRGEFQPAAASGVTLLYFTQQQCPPCRQMQPMLEHLIGRSFPIQVVDAQQHPNLVQQYKVQGTPTFVLLKDGQELKRHSGVLSSYQINSLLIDAGFPTDQNVLTKPNALSPVVNFFDRLRPANRQASRGQRDSKPESPHVDPTATIQWDDLTASERQALQATGRLKIQYHERGQMVTDYGTATVIHRQGSDILLLTCGHVFRDSQGQGAIRVELDFSDGNPKEIVNGQLLLFDAGAPDVALVAAKTSLPIVPMEITGAEYRPEPGTMAFSVGCDQGAAATVRRGNHLAIVRCGAVQGPGQPIDERMARKFAVHGRPVVGRSGGGLFTADGQLIGVCNAAVVESNEGRYSAIDNVHELLAQANLVRLFSSPTIHSPPTNQSPPHSTPGETTRELLLASQPRAMGSQAGVSRPRFVPILEASPTELARSTNPAPSTVARPMQALGQSLR